MARQRISIRNGRLIDPANGVDSKCDLHIADGKVVAVGQPSDGFIADQTFDIPGHVVCPGFVDCRARMREPGFEHKGTIASESAAAARSGITSLCCPPDTEPVIDTPAVAELIRHRSRHAGLARIFPLGAMTQGLDGHHLSEMSALKAAGCVGISNVTRPLANTLVERRAMEYAATFQLTVFLDANDHHLSDRGCAHEGTVSTRLGLPGIPQAAETVAVARDLALAEQTGARIHFCGLSTAAAVRMVARARAGGLPVTADVFAHHLHLTEMDVDGFDSNCHVIPPLRTLTDRDALREGLALGVLSAVCSDHQPHEADAKKAPFPSTAPGISALETLVPLTLRLADEGLLDLPGAIARLTCGPADILGIPQGRLGVGSVADVCILAPDRHWRLEAEQMVSLGHNTPFLGWEFNGRVTHTFLGGRLVHRLDQRP